MSKEKGGQVSRSPIKTDDDELPRLVYEEGSVFDLD
jgi:hypothetical protein